MLTKTPKHHSYLEADPLAPCFSAHSTGSLFLSTFRWFPVSQHIPLVPCFSAHYLQSCAPSFQGTSWYGTIVNKGNAHAKKQSLRVVHDHFTQTPRISQWNRVLQAVWVWLGAFAPQTLLLPVKFLPPGLGIKTPSICHQIAGGISLYWRVNALL